MTAVERIVDAMRCATVLALGLLALASGCPRSTSGVAPSKGSVLDAGYVWTCSADARVGCDGLFALRQASDGDTSTAASIVGQAALGARLRSLEHAKRSIRIQALIFSGDETGLHVSELLKQKKAEGVDVKVIVDAASNLDWQTQWMYFDLKRHGIEVEGYEALYLEWLTAEKLLDPLHANKRFHDKMWVVDDEFAIVGGLNIANEYFRVDDTPLERWMDQDVVLRGPIVEDVVAAFDRNYAFFKQIKADRPKLFNPDNAWKLARAVQDKIDGVDIPYWADEGLTAAVEATAALPPTTGTALQAARFLQSRPRFEETYIGEAYLAQIAEAKQSILIANAYFIPSRQLTRALVDAAARGVEVVVLTNSPESNDIAQVATMSRHTYRKLMKEDGSGVRVAEWIGPDADEGTLHAKFALFDGMDAIVGSYNLDPRSETLNSETAVAVRSRQLVQQLERHFRDDLLAKARTITWTEAKAFHRPREIRAQFELLFALPLTKWL